MVCPPGSDFYCRLLLLNISLLVYAIMCEQRLSTFWIIHSAENKNHDKMNGISFSKHLINGCWKKNKKKCD